MNGSPIQSPLTGPPAELRSYRCLVMSLWLRMPFGGQEGWRENGTVQPDRCGLSGLKLSEPWLLDLTDTNRIYIFCRRPI